MSMTAIKALRIVPLAIHGVTQPVPQCAPAGSGICA